MQIDSGALGIATLNPRTLKIAQGSGTTAWTIVPLTISALTCNTTTAPGLVTVTTSAAHQLVTGQFVTISGTDGGMYPGTFPVTVTDATHFTYQLPTSITGSLQFANIVSPDGLSGTPRVKYTIMAQRMWVVAPAHNIVVGPAGTAVVPVTANTVWYYENPTGSKFELDLWASTGTAADTITILYV